MTLQHVLRTAAPRAGQSNAVRLPICPQCNDLLLAPMLAEHVNEHLVHNHWVCESCGHTFRASFRFRPRHARDGESMRG